MRADRLVAVLLLMQARGRVTAAELAGELERRRTVEVGVRQHVIDQRGGIVRPDPFVLVGEFTEDPGTACCQA